MKNRFFTLFVLAATVLGAVACGKTITDPEPAPVSLTVSPTSVSVKAEGGEATVSFKAPEDWSASCSVQWVSLEPASGKAGDVTLKIKVAANTVTEAREATVTVTCKDAKATVAVKQEAAEEEVPPGPDYSGTWTMIGTILGDNWSKDVAMTKGSGNTWTASLEYRAGDLFKFRMNSSWDVNLGLDGNVAPNGTGYGATLKQDGSNISLPENGVYTITLDLDNVSFTANKTGDVQGDDDRFDGVWTLIGHIMDTDWNQDFEMGDKGDKVWDIDVAFHEGDAFKFRKDADWSVSVGIEGEFTFTESQGLWSANLSTGGGDIALPKEGYWYLIVDLKTLTLTGYYKGDFFVADAIPEDLEPIWENENQTGPAAWNGIYRFALEGTDGNHESIATFPQDVWDYLKTGTFYAVITPTNQDWYSVRVTNGWWQENWKIGDIGKGNPRLMEYGDGQNLIELKFADDPDFVATLDQKHLLFTGEGYMLEGLYASAAAMTGAK